MMYCIKCGAKLADTERACPLCGVKVFNPNIDINFSEPVYPKNANKSQKSHSLFWQAVITILSLFPIIITLECDLQFNSSVTWSGFVIIGIITAYIMVILPTWFKNPNPVIFVPTSFAAAGLYLAYINFATNGDWFLTFAFPILGAVCLIVSAVVTLIKYVKKGKLYIFGGASLLFGALMVLVEFLLNITFNIGGFFGWSLYPLTGFALLGLILIFLGICTPAREAIERKFFL